MALLYKNAPPPLPAIHGYWRYVVQGIEYIGSSSIYKELSILMQ